MPISAPDTCKCSCGKTMSTFIGFRVCDIEQMLQEHKDCDGLNNGLSAEDTKTVIAAKFLDLKKSKKKRAPFTNYG